uniref:Uncharacterized protein n=1 Tax=Palpitomonas bilix TaxID=652834 RepID=A0A7S3GGX5_9EUKA|mmetsp:Transcript_4908/g.10430  ORF Transcript_4908/g.10430 Transcript_4908/m.10430 type:complete len:1316 (+) Transcript_4908:154-4101(+)
MIEIRSASTLLTLCTLLAISSSAVSLDLVGRGASFPELVYLDAAFFYNLYNPEVSITYYPTGSGSGKSAIQQDPPEVDFAGSDSLLKDSEYDAYPDLQMFPTLAGAVVPIYNIPEIAQSGISEPLVLDRTVLADIFLGSITKWNDARIVADNPHLSGILPDQNISVIVRLDKSGTTEIFTSGLDAFSSDFNSLYGGDFSKPEVWSGDHINFAVSSGNSGLARTVLLRPYAIGYVTLGTARDKKLPYASIKNKAGRVIEANEDSLAFSIMEFGGDLDPTRLTASLSDGAGQNVWPIAGYTYLVLRQRMTNVDCTKREAVLAFWTWFYESSTVADIAAGYGFATLPSFVRNIAMTKLRENFLCNGVVVEKSRSTLSVSVNSGILVDYLNFIYAGYSVSGVSGSDTPYSTTSDNLFYGGPNSLMFTVNRTKAIAAVEGGSVALILTADEASSYSTSSSSAGSRSAVFETMDATDLAYPSSASSRALQGDLSSEYSVLSSSSSSTSDLAVEEIGRLGVTLNFNIDGLQSCLQSVQGFGFTVDGPSLSYIFASASGIPVWNHATILAANPGMSTCLANITAACGSFGIFRIVPRLNGNTFPFIHALSAFLTRQGTSILPSDIVDRAEIKAVNFFTTGETLDATACSLATIQISKSSSSESNSIRLALGSQVVDTSLFSTSTRGGAATFMNEWPITVPILGIVPGTESLYSGVKCTTSVTRMIRFLGWMNSTASSTVKDRAWSNKGIFLNDYILGSVPAVSISNENEFSSQVSIKSGSTSPPRFVSVGEMTSWCDGFECPVGTFGTVGTACQPCPAGEVAVSVGSSSCHVCSAGTFVPPNTVASACSPCASGTYQASSGSTSCNQCPANTKTVSVGSTSIQDCVCKEDYYNPAGPGNACEACPVGATCAGGINPPVPVEGYWSVLSEVSELVKNQVDQAEIASLTPSLWEQTNESGSLWACLNSQACPGGDLGNMGNCSLGYEGRFCSVCSVGYFSFATTCFACTNMSERYDVVVIIIMLVVIGAWMGLNRLIALNIDAMDISLVFLQVTAIIGSYDLNWKTELKGIFQALTFVNFNVDLLSPQCLTGEYSYFQKYLINIFLPYAYIGILMALYGIVFGIYKATGGAGGKFGLREVVRRSFRRLSKPHIYSSKKRVANSETQVVPFNENGEDTEGRKPEDEGIELARRNDNSIKNSRSGSNKVPEEGIKREATWKNMDLLLQGHKHKTFTREERMAMFGGVILSNCGSFLDITYASVTEMVFRTFACERMGDKFILRADPSLFCYISPEHQAMMVISGISIVLFVIGVPVLVFAILRYGKT